ncbi:MAG: hypothetical protein IH907_02935 [Proteobacteria bacterium]|nr:hypothetical protein [Pseudomonadota bacterium]
MRKSNLISTAFVACGCLLFLFAGPAAGAVDCIKKPDHPQCNGGGGGGGDHPVNLTFRDADTDKIGSDVAISGTVTYYTDGEPGVSARIRDDGMLMFNISEPDRGLELDFSDQSQSSECVTVCKKDFEDDSVDTRDYPPGAAATVQVFDNGTSQHRTDQFLGMKVGEMLLGEMKLGFGGAKNSTRYSVRFQALGAGAIDTNIEDKSSFLEITRTTRNTWSIEAVDSIENGTGDQALLYSKFRKKGTVFQDEGTYRMPFHLTVVCKSDCPLP